MVSDGLLESQPSTSKQHSVFCTWLCWTRTTKTLQTYSFIGKTLFIHFHQEDFQQEVEQTGHFSQLAMENFNVMEKGVP